MRTFVLIMFEIAAIFGIPRIINELRTALGETAPPVTTAESPSRGGQPVSAVPAKGALAQEVERAQLLQGTLEPSARSVANLQPLPRAVVAAKEIPVQNNGAVARDDDYLPPWMKRAGAGAMPDESPAASVRAPVAAKKKGAAARQIDRKRRRGERGRDDYAGYSRRASRASFSWLDF